MPHFFRWPELLRPIPFGDRLILLGDGWVELVHDYVGDGEDQD